MTAYRLRLPARLAFAVVAAVLAAAFAGAGPLLAQRPAFERASPESVGLFPDALDRATEALQAHVEAGDVAGVVAAVLRDGKLVYAEAVGFRDLETADPMTFDALFRVYSMTRPVASLALLLLAEEGTLGLDDPVERWLPAFADQPVLLDPSTPDPDAARPRAGPITLSHLLTHTSGIGSRSTPMYRAHDVHGWDRSLAEVVDRVARLPLFEDPGTRYRYGMHAEVVGRVVEVASGVDFEAFLRARVLEPLGMSDARFRVDAGAEGRLATVYRRAGDGRLAPHSMEDIPVTGNRTLTSAGVGLVASAEDFLRFGQFFLDEGRAGGATLLGPELLARATTNRVPEALLPLGSGGYWAGSGWSEGGFAVVLEPEAYVHPVTPGTFWWDGSAGTRFWIDPAERMVVVVMGQVSPAGGNGFRERFMTHVQDAVRGPPGSGGERTR